MSFFEKAKDKAEQLIGQAEEKVGQKLGHEDLENTGKRDQSSDEAKDVESDLRDDTAAGPVGDDTAAGPVDDDTPAGVVDGGTNKLSDDDK